MCLDGQSWNVLDASGGYELTPHIPGIRSLTRMDGLVKFIVEFPTKLGTLFLSLYS